MGFLRGMREVLVGAAAGEAPRTCSVIFLRPCFRAQSCCCQNGGGISGIRRGPSAGCRKSWV